MLRSPGVTTMVNGKNKTLYMQTVKSIEEKTKENLSKTLKGRCCEIHIDKL
jgi:ubiquitin-activating enzyme E1 C